MSLPISGFTAIPNPTMLPFMALQSYFMMLLAGEAWQLGKRKISAMSNEDFNDMDIQEHLESLITRMEKSIPSIEKSIASFTPLAQTLTAEMIKTLPEIAKGVGEGIGSIFSDISPTSGLNDDSLQNVRLSQGGINARREGTFNPDGLSTGIPSQFQLDQERARQRTLQASATAKALAEKERLRLLQIERSTIPDIVPTQLQASHQRWARVSTQTLQIARNKAIRDIANGFNRLKALPKTITRTETKIIRATGSAFGRPRPRPVQVTRTNPAIGLLKQEIAKNQKLAVDIQAYLAWRQK